MEHAYAYSKRKFTGDDGVQLNWSDKHADAFIESFG